MKKNYTRKQIAEAIEFWENQLLNESRSRSAETQDSRLTDGQIYDNYKNIGKIIFNNTAGADWPSWKQSLCVTLLAKASTFLLGHNTNSDEKEDLISDIRDFIRNNGWTRV